MSKTEGSTSEAYSYRERARTINFSALVGWLIVIAPTVLFHRDGILSALALLPWLALFGLPIAFGVTWLFAGPILWRVMRRPVSWASAAIWGMTISAAMALVGLAFSRFQGWRASQDPNFTYQIGGGDYVRDVDGVLTAYGWQMELLASFQFFVTGVVVALVVRGIMGPGRDISG